MKSLNIRKKLVTLAVASAISGGAMMAMTAPAHAMNVSQNNIGEVLLFPYYTVKNGFDTVFTVTNTSDRTAIFKVRFREALNSREVRDFNVILSPYDHWSAGVTSTATGGALVRTFDNTCTSPILPASATVSGAREVAFTNALYTNPFADGATSDISRVQEGYFEVILMGMAPNETTDTVAVNAKHTSAGVPLNCAVVDARFLPATLDTWKNTYFPPENVLKGHVVYINVANGTAIDAEPTAIENFQNTLQIIAEPGGLLPSLRSGDLLDDANMIVDGVAVSTAVVGSVDRVSALLRTASIVNEFATGAGAATSWVVTMPTKHEYTDAYTPITGPTLSGTPFGGFSDWFYPTDGKSCDNVEMGMVNREEGRIETVDNTQFSPFNPSNPTVALCYEANVIDFNSSSVFGTGTNRLALDTSGVGTAGWATLTFTEDGTFGGLPAIGFAAIVRDAGGAAVNYGSSIEHTFVKAPPAP